MATRPEPKSKSVVGSGVGMVGVEHENAADAGDKGIGAGASFVRQLLHQARGLKHTGQGYSSISRAQDVVSLSCR